jgi:copper chaperone CopZ
MAEAVMKIEGMSCQHCVMAVKKAIGGLPGIVESNVEIGNAVVTYDEGKTGLAALEAAVEKAGFRVVR